MFIEIFNIYKYFIFCLFVSILLFLISFCFIYQVMDIEKISSYECGFNPFGDSRIKFEVKYYIVGILFIIFDLEIIYIFPWILIIMGDMNLINGFGFFIFILILLCGFLFELLNGALDWV